MDNPIWTALVRPPREKRDMIELLATLPAFEGLTSHELLQVERRLHQRTYRAGETVFEEGMPGAGLYIIQSGEIEIRKKTASGESMQLATIGHRSFFGEMALIDQSPRSASAHAGRDTILLAFCKPDLDKLTEQSPKLTVKILNNVARLVCQRLVNTNEMLETVQSRVAELESGAKGHGNDGG
jgi:CRP-like cAMP-binding protein